MRIGFWRAKTHKASEITEGRFDKTRLEITTDKLLKGAGTGSDPIEIDVPAGGLAIFGDGSDGEGTIAGNTNLSRDMFYNNLTVNNGVTLSTKGYRIFVKGTLTNNGTIANNGGDAGAAGAPGSGASAGSLGGGKNGANQTSGESGGGGGGGGVMVISAKTIVNSSGTIQANGGVGGDASAPIGHNGAGFNGTNASSSLGGAGGNGGDTTAQTGGTGGTVTAPTAAKGGFRASPLVIILKEIETTVVKIAGGAGGGGGALDDANSQQGGGGGGGGGLLVLIYNSLTTGIEEASGGTGGSGYGGGNTGATGSAGTVIKIANT